MQNRYVGDVGDFAKYYLLRRLSSGGKFSKPLSLGIVWYLVPDDHDRHDQDDGRHIGYLGLRQDQDHDAFVDAPERTDGLLSDLDPDLYKALRELVQANTRSVAALMKTGIFPAGTKAYDAFPGGEGDALPPHRFRQRCERRVAWCDQINRTCSEVKHGIIFLDPDNGISLPGYGINVHVAGGQRDAVKYVLPEELSGFYQRASVALVVYHHLSRQAPHADQVATLGNALRQHLKGAVVTPVRCNRGTGRVYLVIQMPDSDLTAVVDEIQDEFVRNRLCRGG